MFKQKLQKLAEDNKLFSDMLRKHMLMAYLGSLGGGAYGYLTADPDVESPATKALSHGLIGGTAFGLGSHYGPDFYLKLQKALKSLRKEK